MTYAWFLGFWADAPVLPANTKRGSHFIQIVLLPYVRGYVWTDDRVKNPRDGLGWLDAYKIGGRFTYPGLMTGRVTQASAFGGGQLPPRHLHRPGGPGARRPARLDHRYPALNRWRDRAPAPRPLDPNTLAEGVAGAKKRPLYNPLAR
jgi:hypothetical protein